MAKNSIDDLRNHLFETIERLKSNNDPKASECEKIKLDDARLICECSKQIVSSIKVENDFLKIISRADEEMLIKRVTTSNMLMQSKS